MRRLADYNGQANIGTAEHMRDRLYSQCTTAGQHGDRPIHFAQLQRQGMLSENGA